MPPYTVYVFTTRVFSFVENIFWKQYLSIIFAFSWGALMEYFLERSPIDFDLSSINLQTTIFDNLQHIKLNKN